MKYICNGVPQGLILGPLLFFIYINDFPNSSKLFNFLMYAEDTTLFCCLKDIKSENKELVLNNMLQRVHSWLKANRLSLNIKKTKYMLFRKQKWTDIRELNLRISIDAIQSVDDFNFLGLHINSKLNWDIKPITLFSMFSFNLYNPSHYSQSLVSIYIIIIIF